MAIDSLPFPINLTQSTSLQPTWKGLHQAVRGMLTADKELIWAVLRGTLLHRIWGLWLSPLPHCTAWSSEGKRPGLGGVGEREHRQALSVRAGAFWEGDEKQWVSGGHQPAPPSTSTEKPGLGGSDLSLSGSASRAVGSPHTFAGL